MRKLLVMFVIIIMILVIAPYFVGMHVQHDYQQLIKNFNTKGYGIIEIERYQRGWFKSFVQLHLKITDPDLIKKINKTDLSYSSLDLSVEQNIQHGPVIYLNIYQVDSLFGLASIKNKIVLSKEIMILLRNVGLNSFDLQLCSLITLRGNFYHVFRIPTFAVDYNKTLIDNKNGIRGNIMILEQGNKFIGEVEFKDVIAFIEQRTHFNISSLKMKFDQRRARYGLWWGDVELILSDLLFTQESLPLLTVDRLKFYEKVKETSNNMSVFTSLDSNRIDINNEVVGPLHVKMKLEKLDAKVLEDMLVAYKLISERGELYQSQLKFKLLSMIPLMFTSKSLFTVENFKVVTQDGKFSMYGKMNWPFGEASASNLFEIIEDANVKFNVHVTIPLADRLVKTATDMPIFHNFTRTKQKSLMGLADLVDQAGQRNYLFLVNLVDEKKLLEPAALELIEMQYADVDMKVYANLLKEMFLTGHITRMTNYMMYWQYMAVRQKVNLFRKAVEDNNVRLKKGVSDQFYNWLKKGNIKKSGTQYISVIEKENGVLKMNGKRLD